MKKNNKRSLVIRKIFQTFTVFIFISFITVFGIIFLVSPKDTYSEIEKRKLMEFPKFSLHQLAKGDYTDNLTR